MLSAMTQRKMKNLTILMLMNKSLINFLDVALAWATTAASAAA